MRVVSLGSGSSGNAVLVQTGRAAVLVDAGFSVRTLESRLRQTGVMPSMLSAVLLTHEHSDHACGAAAFARRYAIPLVADPRTLKAVLEQPRTAAEEQERAVERMELPVGQAIKLHDLDVRGFPISHDAVAPCGYVLATGAWRVCVVTDTGEARMEMIEAMRGAHLLMVEANHDVERLRTGPYPWPLKRRILGATGHLSNEQTAQALISTLDDGPRWVWLAHLSRTNNTPDLARAHVRLHLRQTGLGHVKVEVAPPGVGPVWDSAGLFGEAGGVALRHQDTTRAAAVPSPDGALAPAMVSTKETMTGL